MAYLSVCEVSISRDREFVLSEKKWELVCVRSNLIDLNTRVFVFFSFVEYLFKHKSNTFRLFRRSFARSNQKFRTFDFRLHTFLRSYNWYQSRYHSTRDVEIQQQLGHARNLSNEAASIASWRTWLVARCTYHVHQNSGLSMMESHRAWWLRGS